MASLTPMNPEAHTLTEQAASTAITSLENNSTDTPSSAAPIIIGASVASVVLVVLLIFGSIWYRRRRNQRLERAFITQTFPPQSAQAAVGPHRTYNYPLHTVSKLDFLPPEPEAPPPYGKDSLDGNDDEDKDLEAGIKPPTPPKDMGRTYVRTRGLSGASTPWGSRPASRPISRDGIQYPVPARNWQEGAAF